MTTPATAPPTQGVSPSQEAVPGPEGLDALVELVGGGGAVLLSGAGMSTDSGIPDYRGPTGALRPRAPMTFQTFSGDPLARRRYWARSHLGWPRIRAAAPNSGHLAVGALQRSGHLSAVVTQNVDGLHQAGGARDVLELHGALADVVCLNCRDRSARAELEQRLCELNPGLTAAGTRMNPDGDAELSDEVVAGFRLAGCRACGSDLLKPDVVFFGENVPAARVRRAFELVEAARALLVVGSSLTVFSGYRFVRAAARARIPVAIVNLGPTRGDPLAGLRLDAPLGRVLPRLAASLAGTNCSVAAPLAT